MADPFLFNPVKVIITVLVAFLPPIIYTILIRYSEKYEREPWGSIGQAFLWGATLSIVMVILIRGYFSKYFEEARNRLILMEVDVPEVDEQAAARHEANRREDSFSLLDPMRSVFQVFTGRPDIYDIARQRAEGGEDAGGTEESLGPEPESDE